MEYTKLSDTSWRITVKQDNQTKELVIELPPEILAQMGWDFGDTLDWDTNEDGHVILTKHEDSELTIDE